MRLKTPTILTRQVVFRASSFTVGQTPKISGIHRYISVWFGQKDNMTFISFQINRTLWYASSIDVHNLDLRIRHQVKCFNLHLQHRKLKFSLCQMFTINTTFLAAMAVGIVNSLMLSLQYKYSDKQSLSSNG
ncbi:uncharacterized protein LOC113467085 [Diaphorina citri]|uniref:Uncharacterized protein LOC113467085 n=1 Tax=Diaphorina citri TaxID=121845 RepID=A0A3Q0IRG8_DIACI|nr:uncharacterized protein LOC113467085 [Diaphorina citri]